ncbi:MAG: M56 family metallopeptidase [Defluviitaleaceae bacterium]|nr:M56 family metallopeptidase [Defluviitaleaceae bacterium]MCL2273470.1 M56 family metallopeptidase [Defluviitaleaceae bacterium]
MNGVLLTVLAASTVGSLLFAALMALRFVTRTTFGAAWHYYTGFVPVFFLLGGVRIGGAFMTYVRSLIPAAEEVLSFTFPLIHTYAPAGQWVQEAIPVFLAVPYTARTTGLAQIFAHRWVIITCIWAAGAFVFMAVHVWRYRAARKAILHGSVPISAESPIPVHVSRNIHAPIMLGFTRPVIVLPHVSYREEELAMILAHERAHYRRKDIWLKAIVLLANALHWFNPVVYLLAAHLRTQCEHACDAHMAAKMNPAQRIRYGELLIAVTRQCTQPIGKNFLPVTFTDSQKKLKRRLINMLKTQKNNRARTIVSVLVALAILVTGAITAYAFMPTATEAANADAPTSFGITAVESSSDLTIIALNTPNNATLSMETAARIGINAIEQFFNTSLDGATVYMRYYYDWLQQNLGLTIDDVTIANNAIEPGDGLIASDYLAYPDPSPWWLGHIRHEDGQTRVRFTIDEATLQISNIYYSAQPNAWENKHWSEVGHHLVKPTEEHNQRYGLIALDFADRYSVFDAPAQGARIFGTSAIADENDNFTLTVGVRVRCEEGIVSELTFAGFTTGEVWLIGIAPHSPWHSPFDWVER